MLDLPPIGSEIGVYRLESVIARGGMGVVYIAEDVRMGRTVALKLLASELAENERFRARFLHESRVAAAVNHPNVIPVYDAGEHDGLLYISMRYVEGTDLRGLLQTDGPLELDRTASIITQSASALSATHARDLIHRDVKPANILLVPRTSPDGADHVYLSDFGLAKNLGTLGGLTKSGQFMGTVGYVAPEQIRGQDVDRRTDVYALGCVLFECLTGRPPFRRNDDFATIMAHVNDAPPLVSELREDTPPSIDEVVSQALAKSPDDRFATCDDLSSALRRAAGGSTAPRGRADARATVREDPAAPRGSAWLDADAEKAASPRWGAAYAPTEPGSVLADERGNAAGASGGPPPAPRAPSSAPAPSPLRRIPVGARVLLALVAVGSVVALAIALPGGGDGDPGRDLAAPASPAPSAAAQDVGPWQTKQAAPTARQQVATAVLNGRIWLVGGLVGTQTARATTRVESYDPAINAWSRGPALPRPLHHATAVAWRNELIVIGGWEPRGSNLLGVTSGEVWSLRDGEWVRLAPLRHPRAAAAAAIVDDRIVVTGGQADGRLVEETEILPGGVRWREAADLPTPREHLAAVSDGRFLYAVGGRELSADRNTAVLERYDPRDDRWTKLPSMPVATGSHGAAIVNGRIIAAGGEDATGVTGSLQSYDLKSRSWSQLGAMRTPRHGLGVAAFGNTLYTLGGALGAGHLQSTGRVEALDVE